MVNIKLNGYNAHDSQCLQMNTLMTIIVEETTNPKGKCPGKLAFKGRYNFAIL